MFVRYNEAQILKYLIIVKYTPLFNIIIYLYNSKQLLIQLQGSKNLTVQQVKESFERCCSRLNRRRITPEKAYYYVCDIAQRWRYGCT